MTDRLITDWNFAICSSQLSKMDRLKEILEGVARSGAPMLTIDTKMWKQRAWSEDLLNRAIEFHGHRIQNRLSRLEDAGFEGMVRR